MTASASDVLALEACTAVINADAELMRLRRQYAKVSAELNAAKKAARAARRSLGKAITAAAVELSAGRGSVAIVPAVGSVLP